MSTMRSKCSSSNEAESNKIPLLINPVEQQQQQTNNDNDIIMPTAAPHEEDLILWDYNNNNNNRDNTENHSSLLPTSDSIPITTTITDQHNLNNHLECDDEFDDDVVAEQAAAKSRENGIIIIREHLDSFLEQNPDASYVTWIATLHPENAEVTIDPRFMIPNNPWLTVYEEAIMNTKIITTTTTTSSNTTTTDSSSSPIMNNNNNNNHENNNEITTNFSSFFVEVGGLVPFMIGFIIIISAMMIAFSLESVAIPMYLMAWNCSKMQHSTLLLFCCAIPRGTFCFLTYLFQLFDLILLFIDVCVVELLAAICYLLCGLFAFSHIVGLSYHQKTRKLAHYVRWASRYPMRKYNTVLPRLDELLHSICTTTENNNYNNINNEYVVIEDGA